MTAVSRSLDEIADTIAAHRPRGRRTLVGIAGAPASGKSLLADRLVGQLARLGRIARVVPMDGFHLDNRLLEADGLLHRKGAPETFDLGGVLRLVAALAADPVVCHPLFDRRADRAIAGAGRVGEDCGVVLVEGNYLLFDEPGWRDLAGHWDLSVQCRSDPGELRRRLVDRWLDHGLDRDAAAARADTNDLANARRIAERSMPADMEFDEVLT